MATITLSVPEELKERMNKYPEINWAEWSRESIFKRFERFLLLKVSDEVLKKSKLTKEDAVKLGEEVKHAVARRHGLV